MLKSTLPSRRVIRLHRLTLVIVNILLSIMGVIFAIAGYGFLRNYSCAYFVDLLIAFAIVLLLYVLAYTLEMFITTRFFR